MVLVLRGRGGASSSVPVSSFVKRSGQRLTLNGAYWRFVGANVANAASWSDSTRICGGTVMTEAELTAHLTKLKDAGGTAFRASFYRGFVYGNGSVADYGGLDRCLSVANTLGLKVVASLEDNWGYCFGDTAKTATWYATTYAGTPDDGYPVNYRTWVQNVVGRYASNAGILCWELMNEPRSTNEAQFLAFVTDMAAVIKGIDANHLVMTGVAGLTDSAGGAAAYKTLHALTNVDLLTVHRYDSNNGENAIALEGSPAKLLSPLDIQLFTQTSAWSFGGYDYEPARARQWEHKEGVVGAGTGTYHQVGIVFSTAGRATPFQGDIFLDELRWGSTIHDFEATAIGATPTGWVFGDRVTAATVQAVPSGAKGTKALRITLGTGTLDGYIRRDDDATVVAGQAFSARLYVDNAAPTVDAADSVAAVLRLGRELSKPVVMGESGMTILATTGLQTETRTTRAEKMARKMEAFFGAGGTGWLVWLWTPNEAEAHNIYGSDPLVSEMQRVAGIVASS